MANQFIYLLIHIVNPFSPLIFQNNCPILGQANHSATLSNTEAAHAAEKIGDTRNAQLPYLKPFANPVVTIQGSSQVLSYHFACTPSHIYSKK